MKIKHLFGVLGLGLFAFASAGVGAFALRGAQPKEASADASDTWMSMCSVDMADIISSNDGAVSNIRWHVWGTDLDATYEMHPSGEENYYTVMASFPDDKNINGFQFIFTQTGGTYPGEKYSTDYNQTISKTSPNKDFFFSSMDSWSGDKWNISAPSNYTAYSWFGGTVHNYDRDPVNKVLSVKDITVNNSGFYVESRILRGNNSDHTLGVTKTRSLDYLTGKAIAWLELEPGYTYDFFVYNEYSDDGIFEIKRHSDVSETYIYYVLENGTPTNDYIYSWGGSQQFGAWPGTKITSVEGVQEVTNNGILHFQGGDVGKLIYKIPVKIGYPVGDGQFKLNNNNDWESEARYISGHNAYWYTGSPNSEAGYSIDFLVMAEGFRNSAADYSICNISSEDAANIVNTYNSLGSTMWEDCIDISTVWTYKRDGSDGNEMVDYRAIIEELGKIANVTPAGASRYVPTGVENNANITTVIIVLAVSLSVVAFTTLIVIRKRKHQ